MAQRPVSVSSDETLDKLFPVPSPAPSSQAPGRFAGVTPESTAALQRTLRENHVKWHIFFNDNRFHNHASHQLLAIYQLGATEPLLDAAYQAHTSTQRPAYESPEPITEENFHDHLGDEKFYDAYLKFFTELLLKNGAAETFEEYVFSPKVNHEPPKPGHPPSQMVRRFLSGLLHPLIHLGYGAEFNILGLFAEGLADTAVHYAIVPALTSSSPSQRADMSKSDAKDATVNMPASFPSRVLDTFRRTAQIAQPNKPLRATEKSIHALTLVARILKDDFYSYKALEIPPPGDWNSNGSLDRVLDLCTDKLVEVMEQWTVDGTDSQEVQDKIEELFWTAVILFGVGGWGGRAHSKTGKFNCEFFLVHLVTSVLFLPSLVAYLSPASTTILLRSYLLNTLAIYIARGRPALPIAEFFDSVTPTPAPPTCAGPSPKPAEGTLIPEDPHPNAWLTILQNTVMHPDDHLCKLQRALAHFAALYGTIPAGRFAELGVELDGAEKIDGTLFVRVAGLSMDRLGWTREGQEKGDWDFEGFYHD